MSKIASTSKTTLSTLEVNPAGNFSRIASSSNVSTASKASNETQSQRYIVDPKQVLNIIARGRKNGMEMAVYEEGGPYSTTKSLRLKGVKSNPRTSQSLVQLLESSSTIRTSSTALTSMDTLFPPHFTQPIPQTGEPGIRILSFDATHNNPVLIRSTSRILERIEKILTSHGYPPNTSLCQYFDLICGTGEGGLLALAIGTFKLTAGEAQQLFQKIAGNSFLRSRTLEDALKTILRGGFRGYMSWRLEKKIKKFVREKFGNQEVRMNAFNSGCYTFVVGAEYAAINKAQPVLFRTYDVSTPSISSDHLSGSDTSLDAIDGPSCAIYQAALATMAVPGHYRAQKIAGRKYVSGAAGNANPTEIAENEARRLFPGRRIDLILSIGTGTKDPITAHNPRMSIRRYFKGPDKVHSAMKLFHSQEALGWTKGKCEPGVYFRFDVPHLASKVDNHARPWKCGKFRKFCFRLTYLGAKKVTPLWGRDVGWRRRVIDEDTAAYLDGEEVSEELDICMDMLIGSYEKMKVKGQKEIAMI